MADPKIELIPVKCGDCGATVVKIEGYRMEKETLLTYEGLRKLRLCKGTCNKCGSKYAFDIKTYKIN